MDVDDEIYYGEDPATSTIYNRNYEQSTHRRGIELEGRWRLGPAWLLAASGGYVQPRFANGADIPHVPRVTASARVEWAPRAGRLFTLSARHTGRRYDGNDQANGDFPMLPAYTVFDLAASWNIGEGEIGTGELKLGINNLFDKVYSTLGYSATYYPMPGRHYSLGLRWRF